MLADFDLGHKDHISIPTKEWSQIPSSLRKKIRTIEKKGTGDLTGVYEQARQHVDFNTMYLICDFSGVAKKKNSKKWNATVASVKAQDVGGTPAGKWSAVKASIAVRRYKDDGGKYKSKRSPDNNLKSWFSQNSSKLGTKA